MSLIELRDAYASFRIARGKIVAEVDGVDGDEEDTRGDRFNVDSPRSNVNAFSQKLPADCKVRYIYCYARGSFSRRFPSCLQINEYLYFQHEIYLTNNRENSNENIS